MLTLTVNKRSDIGRAVDKVRRSGAMPGVVYGHGVETIPITIDRTAFEKVYRQAGENTLIDLVLGDAKPVKALIQEVQLDPVKGHLLHVDFHQIRMDEKLITEVPIKLLGESPAVKELGGILLKTIDHVKIECLPQDLVHEFDVDLSSLVNLDQSLHIKDLKSPKGVKILNNEEEIIVTVTPPRSEAELASLKEKVEIDVTKVEKVEDKKAAEGEEAEGEDKKKEDKKKE